MTGRGTNEVLRPAENGENVHVMTHEKTPPGAPVPDVDLGNGYWIRGTDLRPEVRDVEAFRAAQAEDPSLEALIALSEGRLEEALHVFDTLLMENPESLRYQGLRADVLRDQGQLDAAEAVYSDLVARTVDDTRRGPTMRQHRAKVWFHQGRLAEAEAEFDEVLAIREAGGADEGMVASTRQALARVRSARAATDGDS